MSLLIKNGEIVTASERYVADIFCEDETITRIDRKIDNVKADEVIDASGKYVFPGFIDPHVHIYLPFMGTYAKDTHETASRAALVGGTTTFIEMICPARSDKPLEAFELWLGKAEGKSACDFSFHMGVTRYDDEAERDFRRSFGAASPVSKSFSLTKAHSGLRTKSFTIRSSWQRSSASLLPPTVRTPTWFWNCRRNFWRKARPAPNGITGAGRQ